MNLYKFKSKSYEIILYGILLALYLKGNVVLV